MKKILLTLACMFATVATWSYNFMDDNGICYNIYSYSNNIVGVTYYSNENDYVLNTTHYTDDVVIPATVTYNDVEYTVRYISSNAFKNCSSLKSVTIPATIIECGSDAFYQCSSMQAVYISDMTAWLNILFNSNANPLYYAHSLYLNGELVTEVNVPSGVTEIKGSTFAGCTPLAKVTLPDGIQRIGTYAFRDCSSLTSINLPSSLNSLGEYVFHNCSSLNNVVIPEGIQSLGSCFFCNCSSLTNVTLPSTLISIGSSAFSGCSLLKNIELPSGLAKINGSTFERCSSLQSIVIPEGVTSIESYAFEYCNNLKSITFPASLSKINSSSVFYGCSSLNDVYIKDIAAWCNIQFVNVNSSPFYYARNLYLNNELVTDITVPEGTTAIKPYAFYNISCLNSITLPASVTNLGAYAFSGTSAKIIFNGTQPSALGESSITKNNVMLVPAAAVSAYKTAWSEYEHQIISSSAMTEFSVTVEARANSSDVMDQVNTDADSFDAMLDVLKLKVKGSINGYDIMTFRDKMLNLKELDLSEAVVVGDSYEYYQGSHLADSVLGANCFRGQTGLRKIVLPSSITKIGKSAFYECTALQEVVMPDGALKTIDNYAFYNCRSLKSVAFASGVTSIGSYAFQNCNGLESVTLPNDLDRIEHAAFYGCTNLRSVQFPPQLLTLAHTLSVDAINWRR